MPNLNPPSKPKRSVILTEDELVALVQQVIAANTAPAPNVQPSVNESIADLKKKTEEINTLLFVGNSHDSLLTTVSKLRDSMNTIQRIGFAILAAVIASTVGEWIYLVSIHTVKPP